MNGSGGTEGGNSYFFIGVILCVVSAWFFLDSVHVSTGHYGWISGMFRRGGMHGGYLTTSMGIIFVPFFLGVIALFYDASKRWAWWLTGIGVSIIIVEILSRIRFVMSMKTTHLMLILVMFAAGLAFILKSYRPTKLP